MTVETTMVECASAEETGKERSKNLILAGKSKNWYTERIIESERC